MCFMKCLEFEQSVRELARHQLFGELPDGLWEASVRAQALTHAEECAACASRLADARRLSAGLCVLAASEQKLGRKCGSINDLQCNRYPLVAGQSERPPLALLYMASVRRVPRGRN